MQADEQAKELLKSTLQHPISLTTEDLLNVSEPVRLELKKLLTKQHENKKQKSSQIILFIVLFLADSQCTQICNLITFLAT